MRAVYWVWVVGLFGLAGCGARPGTSPGPAASSRFAVPLHYDFGDGQSNPAEADLGPAPAGLRRKTSASCEQRLADARLSALLRRTVVRLSRRVPGMSGARGQDSGSGVLIAPSGQILTAAHVARHGQEWQVVWADGRRESAVVRELDEGLDIARLEIEAPVGTRFPYLKVARREYYAEPDLQGRGVLAAGFSWEGGKFALATTCARFRSIGQVAELKGIEGLEGKLDRGAPVHVFDGDTPLGFSGGPVVDQNGVVVSLACFRTRVSPPGAQTAFVGNRPSEFLEKIGLH